MEARVAGRPATPLPAGRSPCMGGAGRVRAVTPRPGSRAGDASGGRWPHQQLGERKGGAERGQRAGRPRPATAEAGCAASRPGGPGDVGSGLVRRAHPLRLELRLRGRRRRQRRRQQRQRLLDGSSIFAAAPPAPLAAATNNNIRRRHSRHVTQPRAKNKLRPSPLLQLPPTPPLLLGPPRGAGPEAPP